MVGHNDKRHPHVHIVANTVHPYTERTAALKFSKERLSEWKKTTSEISALSAARSA
ncbi:relaxase/mobilization nuclease domain-containing protein [Bradyrhizobium sp. SZCCHNRI1058]|uniref:relaxase/mobilization nuclease domain-containing protein n=1 Tax=Bradyrhizobium sp. SZCCHNRI1058 TaxID=3057279 RepID=UPI003967A3D2